MTLTDDSQILPQPLPPADGEARRDRGQRQIRPRRLCGHPARSALPRHARQHRAARRRRHADDARDRYRRGPVSPAPSLPGPRRAGGVPHLPARLPGRGRRLHDHPARRPAGPDRRRHAQAVRCQAGLGLFDAGPVSRLSLFLYPARHPHHHGGSREARPQSRGGGSRARRRPVGGAARRHIAGAAARLHRLRRNRVRDRHGGVRHGVHARHRHRRAADADLHRVHPVGEHRNRGRALSRARPRRLGDPRARALGRRQHGRGSGIVAMRRLMFTAQLAFTLLVAAFLIVPALLSMLAGVTANYFRGIRSGLTLQWVAQVWELYADTIMQSFMIALITLAVTLIVGVPAAYALHVRGGRLARAVEEIITLPLAIPGLAIALALLLAYGGLSDFRRSSLFIVAGHVVFTLPFMVRSVIAVFALIDVKTLDESASSLGASAWRRFRDVIVPNAVPGILAGSLMVVTLSLGEFNLTWMLHTYQDLA